MDGLCAAAIFGGLKSPELGALIVMYNTLAFSTQGVVGAVTDMLKRHDALTAGACVLTALGFLLPLPDIVKVLLVGLGNSVFHVGGGTVTLRHSGGKAWPLGVFVSPGSVGLALGTMFPKLGWVFLILALACAAGMLLCKSRPETAESRAPAKFSGSFLCALALLFAVAVRSYGGFAVSFPWKTTAALSIAMTLCVFAGKFLGGFLCDRLGPSRSSLVSLPLAAVLIAFCSQWMLPSLLGQLLLNLSMPVTLLLLYRLLPDSPGFSFGIAASVLWPGALAANYIELEGFALSGCIIASFLFGLLAIVITDRKLHLKRSAAL